MGIYGWLIGGLGVMFLLVMVDALVHAGTGISPEEEARILAEERRRRELEAAAKAERRRGACEYQRKNT